VIDDSADEASSHSIDGKEAMRVVNREDASLSQQEIELETRILRLNDNEIREVFNEESETSDLEELRQRNNFRLSNGDVPRPPTPNDDDDDEGDYGYLAVPQKSMFR
jgi:hypothetical protein